MTQFDVHANPDMASRGPYPLVVCLQSSLAAGSSIQIVAPLVPAKSVPGAQGRITPVVRIDEDSYVVLVPLLSSLPTRVLRDRLANIAIHRDALLGAIDLLFYGV